MDKEGEVLYFRQFLRPTYIATSAYSDSGMVGRSCAFNRMVELIHRVAPSSTTVLLLGETGTGKELAAKAIHDASPRCEQPFVPVDCSGLTESLFESELFGHEKGAFTGASSAKRGLAEAAHGGTLFLDEIGDVPLPLQVKLLRLLETEAFRRVGSVETRSADFRLICATHQDLPALVDSGAFRKDLYYRINIFPVSVPPLRERRADIPLLAEVMLRRLAGDSPPRLDPRTLACLARYDYPGNLRELKHILERALLLTDGDTLLPAALAEECRYDAVVEASSEVSTLREMEKRYLRSLKATYKGDNKSLARLLGISERTLYRKLDAL
jgi:DNA-binding NtrC family response regulator